MLTAAHRSHHLVRLAQTLARKARAHRTPGPARLRVATVPAPARERLVIVGGGMVAQRLCERLVERSAIARFDVVVLGEEPLPAYDRVHLKEMWTGRRAEDLLLRPRAWYEAHAIDLRVGERVEAIDREARRVVTASGAAIPYDKLVLATGSAAIVPRIELDAGVELYAYRTSADAGRILEAVQAAQTRGQTIAVLGGGLLGVEAARTLQQIGCSVVVLEASSQLLPRQLDFAAATWLSHVLTGAGIALRLDARATRIARAGAGLRIALDGGDHVDAGVVISAVGARARDELARAAGLRCHGRGGVEVDDGLRTEDPAVFAIGECAAHPGVPPGLVAPGYAMADVLCDNLAGARRRLARQDTVTRLKLDLTEVTVLGNALETTRDRDLIWRDDRSYRRLVLDGRRIVAAISLGPWDELATLQALVTGGRRVPGRAIERFMTTGALGLAGAVPSVATWPDAAIVCQCAQVTCGALRRAIGAGHTTPDALGRATSASTLCGSCRPLVGALCGADPGPSPAALTRPMAWAGIAALALTLAIALVPRLPVAHSITRQGIDRLWTEPLAKQVTGFSLLGLVVIGLSMSLRKRVKRIRFGAYPVWRLLHGVLGVAALVVLLGHTGLRLGNNFNLALMLAFLASALTGGGSAALALASEVAGAGTGMQRAAATVRRLHDYTFWTLPVLVGFHVLKTYYY
jgi:nitrite reductase (NADH) large subunit